MSSPLCTPLAISQNAFATVTTAGNSLRAWSTTTDLAPLQLVILKNDTDKTCQFSFNGGVTYCVELLAGERLVLDRVKVQCAIFVKAITANATSGSVTASCFREG